MNNLPGPGDVTTWPAYSGHPNDPRAPLEFECPDCKEETTRFPCHSCGFSPEDIDEDLIEEE